MDYSFSSQKTLKDSINPSELEQKVAEKEKDWLELGLGLSSLENHELKKKHPLSVSASSSSSPLHEVQIQAHQSKDQKGTLLGLGLGLGLHDNDEYCFTREIDVMTPAKNHHHSLWWRYYHRNHEEIHYHDDDLSSLVVEPWQDMEYSGRFLGMHDDDSPDDYDNGYSTTTTTIARPHYASTGLWFTLQSSSNREGAALPQIPKAYIRVKDENVTVFMVKKYLVTKLGLSNEAQVVICCMGQKLSPTQTLKHVRDLIWLPRVLESLSSAAASVGTLLEGRPNYHLMALNYYEDALFSNNL